MPNKLPIFILSFALGLVFSFSQYPRLKAEENPQSQSLTEVALTNSLFNPQILRNATYEIPDLGSVTLNNGTYQSNSPQSLSVTISDQIAYGNLNNDNTPDAVVILIVNTGDDNNAVYVAAVLSEDNKPDNVDTILLGNQLEVKSVDIQTETIKVAFVPLNKTSTDNSEETIKSYQLISNDLVAKSSEDEDEKPNQTNTENVSPRPSGVGNENRKETPAGELQINF